MISRSSEEKYQTVLNKNTFYFVNKNFEEKYEGEINAIVEGLHQLKLQVDAYGLREEVFEQLLTQPNGLRILLALTGISNESLKRLITLVRIVDDPDLAELTLRSDWSTKIDEENIQEWSDQKIQNLLRENEHFRRGIVRLFFRGAQLSILTRTLPLFELKKLSIAKLGFNFVALLDTLVRYREKGSYSGKTQRNAESILIAQLGELGIEYTTGDLPLLVEEAFNTKRTIDLIIPNENKPKVLVECSFLVTTSSGQGDKSKTEIQLRQLIRKHYPDTLFIGFVDGIGWYVRKQDLRRMVDAYDDVFTFDPDEIARFIELLKKVLE